MNFGLFLDLDNAKLTYFFVFCYISFCFCYIVRWENGVVGIILSYIIDLNLFLRKFVLILDEYFLVIWIVGVVK